MSDEFRARKRMPRFTQCSPYVAARCHISDWLAQGALRLENPAMCGLKLGKTGVVLLSHSHDTPILIGMRDIFACNKCLSIYEITRLRQKPVLPPRCQVCFDSFPPSELGDWLGYERAEPEWSVAEWLAGQTSQFSVPSPQQRLVALSQRRIAAADWPPPSLQLRKLSSVASGRTFDER